MAILPGRTLPATTDAYTTHLQVLRKRVNYTDRGTAVTIGVIPAGAVIMGGGVQIVTTFNGTGTDLLDVGTPADADEFGSALVVSASAPVYVPLDELATNNSYTETADITVTATYSDQNSDATAGAADIIVWYAIKHS